MNINKLRYAKIKHHLDFSRRENKLDKNKDIIKIFMKILPVICILVGAYFLLNSTEIGESITEGGSTDIFLVCLSANTETYRIFGGILLTVGLVRLLQK
jgi:hypothetical protein